ncbi:glycine--tRNA ligase subunit beta [Dongia deserti]|uniref:glycine--tRNA ligase subunit beta n=1 Tax=Dongia deserti TaxID=2268030 RepID=UPI000E655C54|nr:glycine--tRNA ligase subunit beta [Dongia deserti]
MSELLLELFSEEIPARMQARAAEDLQRLMSDKLHEAGLHFTLARTYVTPRRLALVVEELPTAQPDVREERKGPRVGSPQAAIDGFLKSAGLKSIKECEERDTGKGVFYFAVVEKKGRPTADVLPAIIVDCIQQMPWPKSMRFADLTQRWVRPLHHVLAVFAGTVLEGGVPMGGNTELAFTSRTRGHRFLSPGEISVANSSDYLVKLKAAKVVPDPRERRSLILAQCRDRALKEGLTVKSDEGLLDEVTGLVEWPVVLMGRIDPQYMPLPPEVLTTSMRTHQKYFALQDKNGTLAARFLVVANMDTPDKGAQIVAGNERVLRARLSDAMFFWEQDQKVHLADRLPALKDIIFHAQLGTVGQKVTRIEALARHLAGLIPGCNADQAAQAARLAKADLTSGMVGEFPELQGIMGRYYAGIEGHAPEIADAIAHHYRPLGPTDLCPSAPISLAVALADKIDSLVGFFAIDEKPTGSKDPFALRRAALGVIRLILENGLRLKLRDVFGFAYSGFYDQGGFEQNQPKAVIAQLLDFFADRLKVALREQGVRHDLIAAVFALGDEDDLIRLMARVKALQDLVESDAGADLLAAYRRASNIVRIEEKKDAASYDGAADPAKFIQDEERTLFKGLEQEAQIARKRIANEEFVAAMGALANLRAPIDDFFDRVTVNDPDPSLRSNRLRLLSTIRATLNAVADFSKIEAKAEA